LPAIIIKISKIASVHCIELFMCSLFRNRYVIGSKRFQGYDYSSSGKYFITICTNNKIPYFGKIENGVMILSDLGQMLFDEWSKTPDIRPDMNIILDEFVIMPDHFHAIIEICKNPMNDKNKFDFGNRRNTMHGVSTTNTMHGVSTNTINKKIQYKNKFGPQSKNLSSIIRGIKSVITVYSKRTIQEFSWQPRYFDHIIRSIPELNRIRKYIKENPQNWDKKKILP
jgi:putative transposase